MRICREQSRSVYQRCFVAARCIAEAAFLETGCSAIGERMEHLRHSRSMGPREGNKASDVSRIAGGRRGFERRYRLKLAALVKAVERGVGGN